MGYYSTLSFSTEHGTKVKPFKIPSLSYEEAQKRDEKYKYYFSEVSVDKEGNLKVPKWMSKWYDIQGFAKLLSQKMVEGRIDLHFEGEDGEEWSYMIGPDAAVRKNRLGEVTWIHGEKGKELALKVLDEEIASWKEHIADLENKKSEIEESMQEERKHDSHLNPLNL